MDQQPVHTPGLDVFVLTLRLFNLDYLMTSKTSGSERLCTAQVAKLHPPRQSVLEDEQTSWDTERSTVFSWFFSLQVLRTNRRLGQQRFYFTTVSLCASILKYGRKTHHPMCLFQPQQLQYCSHFPAGWNNLFFCPFHTLLPAFTFNYFLFKHIFFLETGV